jgi:glycosyltransferase involved in cell wall biosynthesis
MSPVVLHVSQPVTAGVAVVVTQLVADQVERGWDVHVACPEGWLADRAAALGAVVHHWAAGRSPGPGVLGETRRLAAVVDAVAPDVVHLHSSKAGLAGRLAVRGRIPTVFQPHMWSFQASSGPVGAASLAWERAGARWTHRLLCVGADELAAGRAAGVRCEAVVVPNGVDTAALRPADRAAARRAHGLPAAPTVVCVGRLAEQKGQDLLLTAWPAVLAAVPDARLVLVGDGPMEARWRAAHPDAPSVRWAGPTDDPASWYAAADVVALPSRSEGMALVPLEAMSCARSVVAFDVGGVRESLGEGTGAVVARGDVDALAAALVTRLADPTSADLEGVRGRDRAVRGFDRRRVAAQVADVVAALAVPAAAGGR